MPYKISVHQISESFLPEEVSKKMDWRDKNYSSLFFFMREELVIDYEYWMFANFQNIRTKRFISTVLVF